MLNSVNVPKEFKPLFEQAQQNVQQYFDALHSDPTKGTIDVGGSRYILIRGAAFSVEFYQLVRRLFGSENQSEADLFASGLLYELAHAIGRSDAQNFHHKMNLTDPIAKLSAGPIHFAYTGWAFVDILEESNPSADENFCLLYKHPYSFECDAWLDSKEVNQNPICVMNAGYSSGWCQESFGIPLEARELTCRSLQQADCLFLMAQPQVIEEKIQEYAKDHPELAIIDSTLAFTNSNLDIKSLTHKKPSQQLSKLLSQRLFAYARNLEAVQQQLQNNVQELEREIHQRKAIEKKLQASEKRWRELSDTSFDAILTCEGNKVTSANIASVKLFKQPQAKISTMSLDDLFSVECFQIINDTLYNGGEEITGLKLLKNERENYLDIHIHRVELHNNQQFILAIRDVTEQTTALQHLKRLANYDTLTGLPNRSRFQQIVSRTLSEKRFDKKNALLFMDLDGFKQINDELGHSAGDYLLYEVALKMTLATRSSNTISRLGGDEFSLWMPEITHEHDAEKVAEQIINALNKTIMINGHPVNVTMSIGIAYFPTDGIDYANLIKHADQAMYQAKAKGKNQFQIYRHDNELTDNNITED